MSGSEGVRRAAIVRLLGVLTDGLEREREPMSRLGFVHSSTADESCEDCLANGFVSRDCETCGGRGVVERRRRRDPYDTGASPGWFGSSAAKHERDHEREAELARLEAQLAEPRPQAELVAAARPERWEAERRRLRGRYDIDRLERALSVLAVDDVDAYRAVHAVHVYGWLPDAGRAGACVERALRFLSAWLPDPLRAPPPPADRDEPRPMTLAARNRLIRQQRDEGATAQLLAQRFALSVAQVNRVLAGDDREAA